MIIYRFNIICTVRHALRAVNIKALLLHALRRTVVIKYMSLYVQNKNLCGTTRLTIRKNLTLQSIKCNECIAWVGYC